MSLRLVEDSEAAGLRRLAQIALRKHGEGQNPAAASRHLLTAAIHLHATQVGGAQTVLDVAEYLSALALNNRVCSERDKLADEEPGAA